MQALARWLPRLAARVPRVSLGDWPTPVGPVRVDGGIVWVKDEGRSNARYGGNKIRTLEVWLGHARDRGARRIWALGAYGSNHAIATLIHAPAAGLEAGAILFPQPANEWAIENCGALIATGSPIIALRHIAELPLAALRVGRERGALVMPPGGATTIGTLGALSAAFELAEQIEAGACVPPRRIVLAIGSTCTTAGLLAGLSLAHAVGAWRWPVPIVHGVRVTPWPVTSRLRIANLARRTLARVEQLGGPPVAIELAELVRRLVVDGRELGPGYGVLTERARQAALALRGPRLDGVYSGKAAAALLRLHRAGVGPLLFWASKSTVVLPPPALDAIRGAPRLLRNWMAG
jgi:D-cysteine desulfhydrase